MKLLTLPIMTAAIAFAACSQAAEPTTKLAAEPAAKASMERIGNWLVVKADSHVNFTASLQGKEFTGGFETYDTMIDFKEDAVDEASVTATIYLSSVFAGDKERDTLDIDGARAEMEGKVTIDRTIWEVGTGNWSTDEWASTDVVVDVKIVAKSPF